MHITKKLAAAHAEGRPTYSFEYFPPKTAQGVQNLYDRMDLMYGFGPAFIVAGRRSAFVVPPPAFASGRSGSRRRSCPSSPATGIC